MKKRVLLLDDEPGFCGRLSDILKEKGYEVLTAQNFEEVLPYFNLDQISLVVHGCHKTKTQWDLCQQIRQKFPLIPTIHIEIGNSISDGHRAHGILHYVHRHLGPDREFLSRAKRLIQIGRLSRDRDHAYKMLQNISEIDQCLSDLETPELMKTVVSKIREWTGSSNVFWLADGDIDFFANELWKVRSIAYDPSIDSWESRMVADQPLAPEDLARILNRFDRDRTPEWRGSPYPIVSNQNVAIPVYDRGENRKVGHFILVHPTKSYPSMKYFIKRFVQTLKQAQAFLDAKSLCYLDDVTELYNQRYLGLALDAEISRAQRNKSSFSVLFIDIDHFKRVNDDKGHLVGSECLKKLSSILKKNIRSFDYGFRYGGDEYLLLLVNTEAKAAQEVGERIRKEVENTLFKVENVELKLTLSIGVASFPEHANTKEEIIRIADEAMYHGKSKSRNIVFVAS